MNRVSILKKVLLQHGHCETSTGGSRQGVTRHPSKWKLWAVVLATSLAMLLEIYDFPPYKGYVDAHALWHATTIPITYLWRSFIKYDAKFRTTYSMKKVK
ncbi:hypothetical protein IFM89_030158 [Coptis chinensis]|uniref:Post-GPI attachment to proteins factor 3 n=1 Tax=Coptis chinensis TaxID=261450 RepID=A0A835H3H4_9MAGN|nr:hypothetical protein IFM89_030158 [Coptis chinensis]